MRIESSISSNVLPISYFVLFENKKPEPETLRVR